MTLLDRLAERLLIKAKSPTLPDPGSLYNTATYSITNAGTVSFQGYPDQNGLAATDLQRAKVAMSSAWVFSDVQGIAREVSTANLKVLKRTTSEQPEEVENHPLELLWRKPNPYMGRAYMMQMWAANLLLSGKAFLFAAPSGQDLAELWPVPSWMMSAVPDPKTFIRGYEFRARPDSDPVFIQPEFIVYSRLFNPFDAHDGLSPLAAAMLGIETDLASARWNKDFFGKDNAVPASVISLPSTMTTSDFLRVKQELFDFYGQGQRRTMVARGGDIDIKSMGLGHRDMDFTGGRAFSRDEIDRVFGYPGGYWTASATEANARHAKAVWIENAVWPLLVLLYEDLNTQMVGRWYGEEMIAEFDDIRPRNVELELKELQVHSTIWTIEELRAATGKEPLGDERDKLLLAELKPPSPPPGAVGPDGKPVPPDGSGGGEDNGKDSAPEPEIDTESAPDAGTPDEIKGGGRTARHPFGRTTEDLRRWEVKALKALRRGKPAAVAFQPDVLSPAASDRIRQGLQAATTRAAVRAVFKAEQDPLQAAREDLADTMAKAFHVTRQDVLDAVTSGQSYDLQELSADWRTALVPKLTQVAQLQAAEQGTTHGFAPDRATFKSPARTWAEDYSYELVGGLTDTTQSLLQAAISDYHQDSMTVDELRDRLEPAFGAARAQRIGTTEVTRAAAEGTGMAQDYLAKNGIHMLKVWHTVGDACELCAPNEGLTEDDFGFPPPRHPSCRCAVSLRYAGSHGAAVETPEEEAPAPAFPALPKEGVVTRDFTDDHLSVHYQTHTPLEVNGETYHLPKDHALIDANVYADRIELMKLHVDEGLRGQGVASALVGELADEAAQRDLPLTTTGVFSEGGRGVMEGLVKRGLATREGDNYRIAGAKRTVPKTAQEGS